MLFKITEVASHQRSDVRIHNRRCCPLILANDWRDLARQAHVGSSGQSTSYFADELFVHRILERPQQSYCDRLDALREQIADGTLDLGRIKGDKHTPFVVDSFRYLANEMLRDKRYRLVHCAKMTSLRQTPAGYPTDGAHH